MSIRFQADNDLNARIIDATLRLNPAIDFNTAASAGIHTGTPDLEVLRLQLKRAGSSSVTISEHFPGISLPSLRLVSRRE